MATMVKLNDEWHAYADELVRDGHFGSVGQVVEAGLRQIQSKLEDDLTPEQWTAIDEGLPTRSSSKDGSHYCHSARR